MSRLNFEDELGLRAGGENPPLYAHLNMAWARLGDLVTDSVCPKKQFETQPCTLPQLTYYTFAQTCTPHRDAFGIYQSGEVTKTLAIASWKDSETQRQVSSVPNDRRFAFLHRFEWTEGRRNKTYQHTYGFVGRVASLAYVAASNGMERMGKISDHMAETVHDVLESPQHTATVRTARSLREGGAVRALQIIAELPTHEEIQASLESTVTGIALARNSHDKQVPLEIAANNIQAFTRQQRSQLTHFNVGYVPYAEHIISGLRQLVVATNR